MTIYTADESKWKDTTKRKDKFQIKSILFLWSNKCQLFRFYCFGNCFSFQVELSKKVFRANWTFDFISCQNIFALRVNVSWWKPLKNGRRENNGNSADNKSFMFHRWKHFYANRALNHVVCASALSHPIASFWICQLKVFFFELADAWVLLLFFSFYFHPFIFALSK